MGIVLTCDSASGATLPTALQALLLTSRRAVDLCRVDSCLCRMR